MKRIHSMTQILLAIALVVSMVTPAAAQTVEVTDQFGSVDYDDITGATVYNGDLYVAGSTYGEVGGMAWYPITGAANPADGVWSILDVFMLNNNFVWATGVAGNIMFSNNGGQTWTTQSSGVVENLNSVYFTSGTVGVACGTGGQILRTANGGSSWNPVATGSESLISVFFTDASTGWIVGTGATLLKSDDGGAIWNPGSFGAPVPGGETMYDIYFVDTNTGWACGTNGIIVRTDDGGASWVSQRGAVGETVRSIQMVNATNGYACGSLAAGTHVLTTGDGGTTWTPRTTPGAFDLRDIEADTGGQVIAVGSGGVILKSTDSGVTWVAETSGTSNPLNTVANGFTEAIAAGNSGDIVVSETNGFLRRYDSAGVEVWTIPIATQERDFAFGVAANDSGVYVCGQTYGAFPGQSALLGGAAFVNRYHPTTGAFIESEYITSGNGTIAWDIVSNGDGAYAVVGQTNLSLPGQTSQGGRDAWIKVTDPTEGSLFTRQFGSAGNDDAYAVVGRNNYFWIAGRTDGALPSFTNAGGLDIFIRKYDYNGDPVFDDQYGSASNDWATSLAANDMAVFLGGVAGGSVLGQTSLGGNDAFLAAYEIETDTRMWERQFGTVSTNEIHGLTANESGVFAAGLSLGAMPDQTPLGGVDAFVRRYTSSGDEGWTSQFGSSQLDGTYAIAGDGLKVWAAGRTRGALPGETNAGTDDAFVARLDAVAVPAGNVLYVDQSATGLADGTTWADAFPELRDGMLASDILPGVTEIQIARGTYTPTAGTDRARAFELRDNLDLRGGYTTVDSPDEWVLSGNINNPADSSDNSFNVLRGNSSVTNATQLTVLTIRDGYADGPGDFINGAGYNATAGGSPLFNTVTFEDNFAANLGAGAKIDAANSYFAYCTFRNNVANNDGGGVWTDNNATFEFFQCRFENNTGLRGGGIRTGGIPRLRNCLFNGNHALVDGGAVEQFGDLTMTNCTLINNTAQVSGAAMRIGWEGTPEITNTIIWGNTGPGDAVVILDAIVSNWANSIVQGSGGSGGGWNSLLGTDGGGNLDTDPLFTGPGSYQLIYGSPAIDAGDPLAPGITAADIDQQPRNSGSAPDMGVWEFQQQGGEILYVQQFGTSTDDQVMDMAADSSGYYSVGIVGLFGGGAIPGGTPVGGPDSWIIKRDADANVIWQDQFGTAGLDDARDIAVAGNDVYVVGEAIGLMPGAPTGGSGQDAYLRRYNATTGAVQWTRQLGTAATEIGEGVGVSGANIYMCGRTSGQLGPIQFGGSDAFVSLYTTSGDTLWTQQFGTTGEDYAHDVAADASGVYVTGRTGGVLDGPFNGGSDVFVRKYTTAGGLAWGDQFGSSGFPDRAEAITAFDGRVYVIGLIGGPIGGEPYNGNGDAFLRVYDAGNGAVIWTRLIGTIQQEAGYDVSVNLSGIYVIGGTFGAFPGEINQGSGDVFAAKYDFDGNPMWLKQYGTGGNDQGLTIAAGSLYMGGSTEGDFVGGGNAGQQDAFYAKLAPGPDAAVAAAAYNLEVIFFNAPSSGLVDQNITGDTQLYIANTGADDITTPFDVRLFVSWDSTITIYDEQAAFVTVDSLPAGDTMLVVFPSVVLPDAPVAYKTEPAPGTENYAWGPAYIGPFVDPSDVIAETNEADNTVAAPIYIDDDTDGDGVLDSVDNCPLWSAAGFDANGDGCPDEGRGGRHVEYRAWNDLPVTYFINDAGAPGIADGSDFTAVQDAFNAWQTIPGTRVSFIYGGTTTQNNAIADDGANIVTFDDPDYVFPAGVIAVGLSTSFDTPTIVNGGLAQPGQIIDSDMIFNKTESFATASAGSGIDLLSVATHEAAHLVGISHSAKLTSTMFYKLQPGNGAASLTTEDEATMVKAYPSDATLANTAKIFGYVTQASAAGAAGAIVFAISESAGDTTACEYALPDSGYFEFFLPPDNYSLAIHPLNGASAIGGITAQRVNQLILDNVFTTFVPEYWDALEGPDDDPAARDQIVLAAGQNLGPYIIVTNTDTDPPFVISQSPDSNVTDVAFDASLLIQFNEPMDILGTVSGNLSVTDTITGGFMTGQAFAANDDSTLVFNPSANFAFDTVYKVRLGTGLSDIFGNGLAQPFVYYFRTESAPSFAITDISPTKGIVGSVVAINGFGLASGTVSFNGAQATTVLEDTDTRLVVEVPAGATSGGVVVTEFGSDIDSNPLSFTVLTASEVPKGYEDGVSQLVGLPLDITLSPDGNEAWVATDLGYAVVNTDASSTAFMTNTEVSTITNGLNSIDVAPNGTVYAIGKVNRKLYRIDPVTRAVLAELPTSVEPRGVVVEPLGKRAYVATDAGFIQIWDIKSGSPTFDHIVGQLNSPDVNIRRKMAVDPANRYLLAATGTGKLLVFDLTTDTFLTDVPINSDPKDVIVEPTGQRCYVTDETGLVNVVSLETFTFVENVMTGGTLRGADITPAGGLLYAVNRELNRYDVIDLRVGSPTFRTVAATIPLRINPIDAVVAPEGDHAYSLSEFQRQVVSTAIGVGPTITSMAPLAGPTGSVVVIAGEGFMVDSLLQVSFNGTIVNAPNRTDSSVVVTVPDGAPSGPVKVIGVNPTGPVVESNTVNFDVLGPSGAGGLRLASVLGTPGGGQVTNALAVSPTGHLVLFGGTAGEVYFYDADPASSTFGSVTSVVAIPVVPIADIAFTPDGRRAFAMSEFTQIVAEINTNPDDLNYQNVQTFSADISDSGIFRIEVSRDGGKLLLSDPGVSRFQVRDIRPGPGQYQLIQSVPLFGLGSNGQVREFAAHPGGRYVYLSVDDQSNGDIKVLDLQNNTVVTQIPMPGGGVDVFTPTSADFTPDGDRCYIMTEHQQAPFERGVLILDTSDPVNPVITNDVIVPGNDFPTEEHLRVSPKGDNAIYDLVSGPIVNNTLLDSIAPLNSVVGPPAGSIIGHDYSPDGDLYFVTNVTFDSLYVFDFTGADEIVSVSGDGQTGIVSQELTQPLVVRVREQASGGGIAGVPVTFSVSGDSGMLRPEGSSAAGSSTQTVSTDSDGDASVMWTVGPTIGTNTQQVTVSGLGLTGSPISFDASTVQNPDLLPLMVQGFTPVDGTASVSVTTAMIVKFSKAVNPTTVTSSTFFLHKGDMVPVPVVYGFSNQNKVVSMTPVTNLMPNTTYTMEVTAGVLDNIAMALQNPPSASFATVVVPPPLSLNSVTPVASSVGVTAVLSGIGFSEVPSNNVVTFNGVTALVSDAGDDFIDVQVPVGATTGPIVVTNTLTSQSGSIAYTILQASSSVVDEVTSNVSTGSPTRGTAITPDGAIAYCVSPDANSIVPIDLDAQVSLPGISVGDNPFGIVINPEGTRAYVTNLGDGTVSVVDLTLAQTIGSIVVGTGPGDLEITPDGDRLVVVNEASEELSIIDTDELSETFNEVVGSVDTNGRNPRGVAITPDGGTIYVGTSTGYLVLNAATYGVVRDVSNGSKSTRSANITPDGTLLIVLTTEGAIDIFDIVPGSDSENQVVGSVDTNGKTTRSANITPDGTQLYLVMEEEDLILVVSLEGIGSVGVIHPAGSAEDAASSAVVAEIIDTIYAGEDPAFVAFDPRGTGVAVVTNPGDNTVSILDPNGVLAAKLVDASIRVTPRTLNTKSRGRYIKGLIDLPAPYSVHDIDLSTIYLAGIPATDSVPAVVGQCSFSDVDSDGVDELEARFDRAEFQMKIPEGEYVPVRITGFLGNNTYFLGQDVIRTIRPTITHPKGGDMLVGGSVTTIAWTTPAGVHVDKVDVYWSPDDGDEWFAIADMVPNTEEVTWYVPMVMTDKCRVMVTLYHHDEDVGSGMNQDAFTIEAPVPVALGGFQVNVADRAAKLEWYTSFESRIEGFHVLRSEEENGVYDRVTSEIIPASGNVGGGSYEFLDPTVQPNQRYFYKLEEVTSTGTGGQQFGPFEFIYRAVFALEQNVPNPFNPTTTIRFTLPEAQHVSLIVYDVAGRVVRTLVNETRQAANYDVEWDGRDAHGRQVASGVYFYRLQAGKHSATKKMLMLK